MTNKKPKPPVSSPSAEPLKAAYVTSYEITDEPIRDREYRRLPAHVKEALERLHHESETRPRNAIPELQQLIERYPQVPQFYNYLTIAYSGIGALDKAEAVTRASIRANPDYLFARLNYAELCLMRKDYAKIPEIFDHKFDLGLLYPKRKRFHITEVANFTGLIGLYFLAINERGLAEKYNAALQEAAPDFPMAQKLRRALTPGLFARLWKRLTGS
jgi:tetratricopeptide (TPR) repeat protein